MYRAKIRLVAAFLAMPLVLSVPTASASVASPAEEPQEVVAAIQDAAEGHVDECAYTQTAVVELDDGSTLALDDSGELVDVASAPADSFVDCVGAEPSIDTQATAANASSDWSARKVFSSRNRYFGKTDSNGEFDAQYTPRTVAWSYRISAPLKAIAVGNATASASRSPWRSPQVPCTYSKVQSVGYIFHSSCPGNTGLVDWRLTASIGFPVEVAGNPGKATIRWIFNYSTV